MERVLAKDRHAGARGDVEDARHGVPAVEGTRETFSESIDALEQAEEISEQITQGLFRSELDRFDKIKAEQLRDMMGQLSASHFQYAKRLGIMWQGFINELGFDPQQMMDKAQTVFKANPGDMKAGGGVH